MLSALTGVCDSNVSRTTDVPKAFLNSVSAGEEQELTCQRL